MIGIDAQAYNNNNKTLTYLDANKLVSFHTTGI